MPVLTPVELCGVGRRFGPVAALGGIDLRLEAASLTLLAGGNGAGKSTLLRLLAGLLLPSTGTIRYAGCSAGQLGPLLSAGRSFLGHETQLYGDLTLRENLFLAAELRGLSRSEVELWLEHFALRQVADRPALVCSRGQAQRAALARTFLGYPSLVLLDEPTAGLDAEGVQALRDAVAAAIDRGAAVVLATHDPATLPWLKARTLFLSGGRLVGGQAGGAP